MTGMTLTHWAPEPIVLIAARHLAAISRRSSSGADAGEMLFWLSIASGTIVVVCLAIYVATRAHDRWHHNCQTSLFLGLCRVHRLNPQTRRLLRRIANYHRLHRPADLFLEPRWLDPARLGGPLRTRHAEIAAVRQRLFADREPGAEA
jgi:hypothetical protein